MREIKFRVWKEELKQFVDDGVWLQDNNDQYKTISFTGHDNRVIEQFTGLTDKNGKEIYEGDMVQGYSAYYCYVIEYIGFGFKWKPILNEDGRNLSCADKMPKYDLEEIIDSEESFNTHHEVIGNIHDNPELLEK